MIKSASFQIMLILFETTVVIAHSWVACTNYFTVTTDRLTFGEFDRSKCGGYPRNFQNQYNQELINGWAIDTNNEWERNTCKTLFNSNDYNNVLPMANYASNQIIHLSHPAKTHVAETCNNNPFIPSTSLKLKMSKVDNQDTFDIDIAMIGPDHRNGEIDYLGYQRCYKFCENQDKAHCLTSWQLPTIFFSGRYSFIWIWEFNPGQFYSSCFDAFILASNSNNDTILFTTPLSTITPSTPSTITPSTPTLNPNNDTILSTTPLSPITTSTPTLNSNNDTIVFTPLLSTPIVTVISTPIVTPIVTPIITVISTPTSTPIVAVISTPTSTPIVTVISTPTSTPIVAVISTPTSTTLMLITSNANEIANIFTTLFKSFKFIFNGTIDITMLP